MHDLCTGCCGRLQVVVVTSDKMGAGTDANVFIDINGLDGSTTGRMLLNNKGNDFEKGQTDTFTVRQCSVCARMHAHS
jgi:hypothetical protein